MWCTSSEEGVQYSIRGQVRWEEGARGQSPGRTGGREQFTPDGSPGRSYDHTWKVT